jgi:hypothetical protein
MAMSGHPSQYALDRAALGAPIEADVAAHLARCGACSATVEARRRGAEPPPWVSALAIGPPPPARKPRRRWLVPVPALAAAVLLAALVLRGEHAALPGGATREKGAPRVTLYVKRGDKVSAWDGRASVRSGDRLRLAVRGAGYAHVSVASLPSPEGEPVLLYGGPLSPGDETLAPLSFRVDERGGAEILSVVVSARPVGLDAHAESPEHVRARGDWSTRLHIPKETDR